MTFDYRSRLDALRRNWLQWAYGLSLVIGLTLVQSFNLVNPRQIDLQLGERAQEAVLAPLTKTYESDVLTVRAREQAAARIPDEYRSWNPQIGRDQGDRAEHVFDFLATVRADRSADFETKVAYIGAIDGLIVNRDIADAILTLSNTAFEEVRRETIGVIDEIMQRDIFDDGTLDAEQQVARAVSLRLSMAQEGVVKAVAPQFIVANRLFDAELTAQRRADARQGVELVERSVTKGEEIIPVGKIITAEDLEMLEELGLRQGDADWWAFARIALVSALAVIGIMLYWSQYHGQRYDDRRHLAVFFLLLMLFTFGAKLMDGLPDTFALLFPAASLAMLIAVIFNHRFAIVVSLALAGIVGFMSSESLEMAFYVMCGSLVAIFWLRDASRLNALFRAGLVVGIANVVVILLFNGSALSDPINLFQLSVLGLFNGVISASLTVAGFFIVGSFFGIITTLQVQELSHLDHPLLRELLRRAPGTYHHSIMVANLAEQAAERIGADSNLVRVGAFYHDVGKMLRPPFFTENQEGVNPHDSLDPRSSARIIKSHVSEGLELARRHHLPRRIQDFISEHHGDRLLTHFYEKAVEAAGDEKLVPMERFRYPGPRPRSRETGIVAMADSIEAASTAVRPNNPAACERLVNTLVDDLVRDGQLDDSGLTLADIKQCRDSFIDTLQGRFHARIKYRGNEELERANTPDIEQVRDEPVAVLVEPQPERL